MSKGVAQIHKKNAFKLGNILGRNIVNTDLKVINYVTIAAKLLLCYVVLLSVYRHGENKILINPGDTGSHGDRTSLREDLT